MQLSEDEFMLKYGNNWGHCKRNTLPPNEIEFTGLPCNNNVMKWKNELNKNQWKKINFINRLKYAEHKMFSICMEVNLMYESNDFEKMFEALSKIKKLKINII